MLIIREEKMKYIFLLLCLTTVCLFAQNYGILQGKVVDKSTQKPIPFANVILTGTSYGAATNQNGEFKIQNIPIGRYTLRVSYLGYNTYVNPDIVISTGQPVNLLIEMNESIIQLKEEAIVKGELFQKDFREIVSTHNLNYEEVRRSPGAAGDLNRVLLSFPSVLQSTDNRNDLLVRGGNPSEVLYLVDNIEVPNINHFGTQGSGGGAMGIINVNLIREVNFSAGGFPVKYGDKLSSIVDIKLREGSRENYYGDINMSMAGFGAILEGPISQRGSFLFSARRSYLDIIAKLNATGVGASSVIPNYSNFQGKIVYDLDSMNQVSIVALGGFDRVRYQENEYNLIPFFKKYKIKNDQDELATGINFRTLWSDKVYSLMTISNSYNFFFTDVFLLRTGLIFYRNTSYERENHFKLEVNFKPYPDFEFSLGGGLKLINFSHDVIYAGDTLFIRNDSEIDTLIYSTLDYSSNIKSRKYFLFGQVTNWFREKIKTTFGIRYDYFSLVEEKSIFSFRGGLSYYFTPITNLNLFYGVYYQNPPYIWLSADETSKRLKQMKTTHLILGFEHLFSEDLKLSIELYNKIYSQIPTSKTAKFIIATNEGVDYGPFLMANLSSNGSGYARGIEFTLQKKLMNKIYGIVSFAKSTIRFTAEDGIERPGSFDYQNVFTFIFGYIPDEKYEFSIKWRYLGGRPYTPFDENLSRIYNRGVLDFSRINSIRYPSYHRLDLRVDRRWHFKKWNIVTYFELQNAYFRKNIYDYEWDPVEHKTVEIYNWRFFPIGGINVLF